jgi:hypothetical protein
VEFLLCGKFLSAQEPPDFQDEPPVPVSEKWYRSNASGIALEEIPSRFAALRNEYTLSVAGAGYDEIPDVLMDYYDPVYSVEVRILFEEGEELRRQWIFRDEKGITRLNASGSGGLFGGVVKEDEVRDGFIEIYNDERFIVEEYQFIADDSELMTRFFYNEGALIRTESWRKEAPGELTLLVTDYYRYTRFHALRTIERIYHADEAEAERIFFPGIADGFSFGIETTVSGVFYGTEFFEDISSAGTARSVFTVDSRGRVLTEKRMDEDGNLIGEIVNTWTGDRLASVEWKAAGDERRIEYEYDAEGNRILEMNYRNGILERLVRSDGANKEIEELYMKGELILRAIWEDGRKVSEERIRGSN